MPTEIVDRKEDRPARSVRAIIRIMDGLIGGHYEQDPSTIGQEDVVLTSPDGVRVNYHCGLSENSCHLRISLDNSRASEEQLRREEAFLREELRDHLD
jgi:hypothetical protein